MIKSDNDMEFVAENLRNIMPFVHGGQVETKAVIHTPGTDIAQLRENATKEGFHVEDESHVIEGRHMLTLTWHF